MGKEKSLRTAKPSRLSTLRRALNRNNCLPVRRPLLEGLLTPEELYELPSHMREERFREWEAYRESLMLTDRLNLESALVRISLCSYMNSLRSALLAIPLNRNRHYSWCVCDEWTRTLAQS